jgi:hypothetical protein
MENTRITVETFDDHEVLNYLINIAIRSERDRSNYDFMKSMEQAFERADNKECN